MLYFDPIYFIMVGPALLLSVYASLKVKRAFGKYSKVATASGLTGAQAAANMLRREGLNDVEIEETKGFLSDHYDPRTKTLRLSPDVYSGRSVASVGVAAHEAGHALQDAHGYTPLKFRSAIVPMASIGSKLAWPLLIIGGIIMYAGSVFGLVMVKVGIILFSLAVAFQLITLPVEFNASRRALAALSSSGMLMEEEVSGARKVLSAAALTYVAAAAAAVLQLLYFLLRFGLLGGRD
ncbi:MAG: zinc metallopeptidase [Deltaproteobacteria bacterium]|uniref:Zinc metallopeptidase n=1 Tax=Candidatus Zymogenus saltonus TaxID=2844893 RepID=A0A9D8KHT8_9DELT|nr:zinc metallopeptidase [Candidatus Zymogenus saltonus]